MTWLVADDVMCGGGSAACAPYVPDRFNLASEVPEFHPTSLVLRECTPQIGPSLPQALARAEPSLSH